MMTRSTPKRPFARMKAAACSLVVGLALPLHAVAGTQVLTPPTDGDGSINERFGHAVAATADTVVVGAPLDRTALPDGVIGDGSAVVYSRQGTTLARLALLTPSDGENAAFSFGESLAIEGDRLVVGAPLRENKAGQSAGAVYVFERTGGAWVEVAKLIGPDAAFDARFGQAVALVDGRLYVGAPNQRRVYVFEGGGESWDAVDVVEAPAGAARFGTSFAVCGDRLLVGDPRAQAAGAPVESGLAHRYERVGDDFVLATTFGAPAPLANAAFGKRVACEGEVFVVGASGDPLGAPMTPGAAYVYDFAQPGAVLLDTLAPVQNETYGLFGGSLAVEGDVIAVGMPGFNVAEGSVTFFKRNGNDWSVADTETRTDGNESLDAFGIDVALSGTVAIVGADYDAIGENYSQGSIEVFERVGDDYVSAGLVDRGRGAQGDLFGLTVDVAGDTVLVGAPFEETIYDLNDAGTISFYRRNNGAFALLQKFESPEPESQDLFGYSVAIAGDVAVSGTPGAIVGGDLSEGAAYVYRRVGGTWSYEAKLVAPNGLTNDFFGEAVATDGVRIVVGASGRDAAGPEAGVAYVFVRSGASWTLEATLLPPVNEGGRAGAAVAIEGDLVAVGAPFTMLPGGADFAGTVHAWRRVGSSWSAAGTLTGAPVSKFQQLGSAVAIASGRVFAGAPGEKVGAVAGSGAVYVFATDALGALAQVQRIVRTPLEPGEFFGVSLDATADALVVGAPGVSEFGADAGVAMRYARGAGNLFGFDDLLTAPVPQPSAQFGTAVALDGDVTAIGEPDRDGENPDEGAVTVFDREDALFSNGFE